MELIRAGEGEVIAAKRLAERVFDNDWALNHCFKHDPTAIVNFVLTPFIAFVLVQSFYYRNLKPQMRGLFGTLISITDELYASLYRIQLRTTFAMHAPNPPP